MPQESLITRTGRLNPVQDVTSVTEQAQSTQELQELSNKFGELGDVFRQKKVQSDVITAKIAFEMEKQMPGGLEPEAEVAFGNMTAENAANKFITEFTLDNDVRSSLILQNPAGDSPSAMQELYERQVGDGISKFLTNTGLNDFQIAHVAPLLDKYKAVATSQFTTTLAKQIDDTKTAEGNEAIKGAIENQVVFHTELESTGVESDLKELFTVKWHQQLKSNIMKALPYFTRDEVDNLIVDNLSLIASDPDDPRPDILEYLDKPQKGDRVRFSSIKGLGKKIASAQSSARRTLIAVNKARATQEAALLKQKEKDSEDRASMWLTDQLKSGPQDLNALQSEMERFFPDTKPSAIRAMITNANTRLTSPASILASKTAFATLSQKIAGADYATFQDVQATALYQEMGFKQRNDILADFTRWRQGVVAKGSVIQSEEADNIADILEQSMFNKLSLAQQTDLLVRAKVSGQPIQLPLKQNIVLDRIIGEFNRKARDLRDRFIDDPTKIDDAIAKLGFDTLQRLGISNVDAEEFGVSTTPDRPAEETFAGEAFEELSLEDEEIPEITPQSIPHPTGSGSMSSDISKQNETILPTQPNPIVHVTPANPQKQEAIIKSIQTLQSFDPNVDISVEGGQFLRSSDPEQQAVIDSTIKTLSEAGQALSKAASEAPEVLQKGVERALESFSNLAKQISDPLGKAVKDLSQGILENVIQPLITTGVTEAGGFVPEGSDLGDNTETEAADVIQPNASPQETQAATSVAEFDTQGDLIETFDPNTTDLPEIQNLRQFTAGGEGAAGPDPRIAQFKADREKFISKETETTRLKFLSEREGFTTKAEEIELGGGKTDKTLTVGGGISAGLFKKLTGKTLKKGASISKKESEKLTKQFLKKEIDPELELINKRFALTENQKVAISSLLFNIGLTQWKKSEARKALLKGNISGFVKEAFDSKIGFVKSQGDIIKGLINRRKLEQDLFLKKDN